MITGHIDLGPMDRVFSELKFRASEMRPVMEASGRSGLGEFERSFAQSGPGWAPNRAGTRTMMKSGRMFRSYTVIGADGNVFRVTSNSAEVGSDLPYAEINNSGGVQQLPNGKLQRIPARPVLRQPSTLFISQIERYAVSHFQVKA